MTIGIYLLRFTGTDKVYIGQSLRIEERFTKHIHRMKTGIANYKLLEAYNKYGLPNLEVLADGSIDDDLDAMETETIEIYDSVNNGLNIRSKASGGGVGLQGEKHGNSKYSNANIIEVFKKLVASNMPFSEISNNTNVSIHTIRDISKGRSHRWLRDIYPDDYEVLISLKDVREKNTAKYQGIEYPVILSPEGIEYTVTNIGAFAREHDLNKSHLCGVLNGLRKTHLKWKLK